MINNNYQLSKLELLKSDDISHR